MSDNELDAELLALAGSGNDSVSETETTKKAPKVTKSPRTTLPAVRASSPKPRTPHKKPTASKKAMKPSRAAVAKARPTDESEEEGQASSTQHSPASLGSGAMSESESDPPPDALDLKDDGVAIFPVDGQFYSEKDKSNIMAMSEIDREQILADRAQEIERRTQDLHLRRLLQARENDEALAADKKKRKVAAADLEESPRKISRQKTKANENLEAYKRQREQKHEQRRRDDDRKQEPRSPNHEARDSDADAEGESDVEWDDAATRTRPTGDEPLPELRDFERVRVGRSNFAKVCFYPGFEDTIKGCFCRVSIGVDKATGLNQYRMTQIKGFTEGKLYTMEGSNGKSFQTDQYAIVAHGKAEREWPFLTCSDSKFTEAEFERYKTSLSSDGLRMPTMAMLSTKLDGIHNLLNRTWTDGEISERLKRPAAIQAKHIEHNRIRLAGARERAVAEGDEAKIARLDHELASLDAPRPVLGSGSTTGATKSSAGKTPNQQDRLAALNAANRKANADRIRRAQIAEKRADQLAQAAVARGEATANPFARVKTRAKVHHDASIDNLQVPGKGLDDLFGENSDRSRAGTPLAGGNTNVSKNGATSRAGTPVGSQKIEKKTVVVAMKRKNMDDEILSAMDLGIEIDI